MKTRKILIIWLSSLALCVLLVLGLYGRQTLALLGAQTQVANTGVAGQITVEIDSRTDELKQSDIGLINTGTSECYVRMRVEMPNEKITGTGAQESLFIGTFNTLAWTLGDDGYYYYNEVLPAGEKTDYLLRFATYRNIPTDACLNQLPIITYAEGVQSAYLNLESDSGSLIEAQLAFQQVRQ